MFSTFNVLLSKRVAIFFQWEAQKTLTRVDHSL